MPLAAAAAAGDPARPPPPSPPPPTSVLGPGFRFHPTDEELVRYYLRRRVTGQPLRFDCIAEVDLYNFDPWELPGHSRLKTRDLEWYFYTGLDKKYAHGGKTNRATGNGYWKTTGKDHPVANQARVVGMRKTLVYHAGRAPVGVRTNWVMHEYRLEDNELVEAGVSQDTYVLCRIFEKSGAGPKNGEQYGAPFIEEEWEDEENEIALPKGKADTDDFATQGLGYLGADVANATMQQSITSTSQTGPPTLVLTDSKPPLHTSEFIEQTPMKENNEAICHVKLPYEDYIELNDVISATNVGCTSNLNDETFDCDVLFNDENILSEFLSVDGAFLQEDDLACPIEGGGLLNIPEASSPDTDWVEEILKKMSDVDDNQQTLSTLNAYLFSTHQSVITETPVTAQASQEHDIAGSSSSKRKANSSYHGFEEKATSDAEVTEWPDATDMWYKDFGYGWGEPLAKRLHGMLESIPFSPAFAADTPFEVSGKAMEEEPVLTFAGPLRIHTSIFHVTDNSMAHHIPKNWLLHKEGINNQEGILITCASERVMSNKTAASSLFLSELFLCFMWLVLLAIGAKISVCVYAK